MALDPDQAKLCGCPWHTSDDALVPYEEIADGIGYRYHNCPIHFVPDSVFEWHKDYSFFSKFPNCQMPNFEEISPKWMDAVNVYENWLAIKQEEYREKYSPKK